MAQLKQESEQEQLTLPGGVPEAARLLGISRGSAYQLAARGELPGVIKLGGRFVVSRAAFMRAINENAS
jgi:excisionase family DNA binding protein